MFTEHAVRRCSTVQTLCVKFTVTQTMIGSEEDPKRIQTRLKVEVINTRQMMMNMKHTNAEFASPSTAAECSALNVKAVNEYHRPPSMCLTVKS